MANRSYLYSTNVIPESNAKANGRKLIGIAEWNSDIPIVFKILMSGNPKTCPSSIWEEEDHQETALIGDYVTGLKNLENFLSKIDLPSANELIAETFNFLNKAENQNQYLVLECGEIFCMNEKLHFEQNLELLEQIKNLHPEIEQALQSLMPPPKPSTQSLGFFARLFGRNPKPSNLERDTMQAIYGLGLGNWSNVLYFDFSRE